MSEATELVVIEKADAVSVFTDKSRIEKILERIETEVRSFVPDLSTGVSRKAIASMANKVARSKTYIDGVGKDAVAELKELPRQIDEQRRIVRERLDALKDEVRLPLTQWEAEQERIKAEEEARIAAEKLAAQIEADHEIALLLNDKFDRDAAEAKAEAERQRIAHEEEIKRQAVEQARAESEQQQQRERQQHLDALSEISGIQHQVIIAQSGRSGVRKGGTIECIRETLAETDAWHIDERFGALQETAEKVKKQAVEQIKQMLGSAELIQKQQDDLAAAERSKQEAIDLEQRKAREEADRLKREADAKEAARLAEQKRIDDEAKRIADEAAARAANEAHRKTIGTAVVNALMGHAGLTRAQAIDVLMQIKDGNIPHTSITY
ncbi:coiled-coil domain-containing protein [Pantoea trifolii]|uniref:hypothetical protein n=1 Tax=Candidatus Pantoea symbiotica TaxID=1884370 RepID=UPI0024139438|nr:hypothetical protein [Pantoea rodasii]